MAHKEKDFAKTYDQKDWEFYVRQHQWAIHVLSTFSHILTEKHLAYCTKAKEQAEERYPCLKKEFNACHLPDL